MKTLFRLVVLLAILSVSACTPEATATPFVWPPSRTTEGDILLNEDIWFSFLDGPTFYRQEGDPIGLREDQLNAFMVHVGYMKSQESALDFILVSEQARMVEFVSQEQLLDWNVTTFNISAENEETLNGGLFAALYLAAHWLKNPKTLNAQVFDAETYGLTQYYALTGKTYEEYVARMKALGRDPTAPCNGCGTNIFWDGLQKELARNGVTEPVLFHP